MNDRKMKAFLSIIILWISIAVFAHPVRGEQDIFNAVMWNKIEIVKSILEKNPDAINWKNRIGETPLFYAAYVSPEITKLLIRHKADVNARDNRGNVPLRECAFRHNTEAARILIANGADVNVRNKIGESILYTAVKFGAENLIDILLEKGADKNVKSSEAAGMLPLAVQNRLIKFIDYLFSRGVELTTKGKAGINLLHDAAQCPHKGLVDRLINSGVDTRSLNRKGGSLVHSAAIGGMIGIIESLIKKGAAVNIRNYFSLSPLHKAAQYGKTEVVKLLLAKGADIDIKSNDGTTPYHLAVEEGHREVVDLLILKGADTGKKKFPRLSGPYLGQKPPGKTPELFAPGIISNDHLQEFAGTFSPDGKEFFFTRRKTVPDQRIWYTKLEKGVWAEPELAPFTYDVMFEYEPHISLDGKKLFYGSMRPKPGSNKPTQRPFIWYVEKKPGGWGKPKYMPPAINDARPMYISSAANGNLYFTGRGGVLKSEFLKGEYAPPVPLPAAINSRKFVHPFTASDESYIIGDGNPDTPGINTDIYIAFRKKDGTWAKAVKIEDGVSSDSNELAASVSPDGKYLFFQSKRTGSMNIYWVSTKILDKYRPGN